MKKSAIKLYLKNNIDMRKSEIFPRLYQLFDILEIALDVVA
jgi:hypothetical protein